MLHPRKRVGRECGSMLELAVPIEDTVSTQPLGCPHVIVPPRLSVTHSIFRARSETRLHLILGDRAGPLRMSTNADRTIEAIAREEPSCICPTTCDRRTGNEKRLRAPRGCIPCQGQRTRRPTRRSQRELDDWSREQWFRTWKFGMFEGEAPSCMGSENTNVE